MQRITVGQSHAVSVLRVLAMTAILVCHILQSYDNQWAWVLNVGVQIFLVLSGFLYGHKNVDNWRIWFSSRLRKLYVPFVLFAVLCLGIMKAFTETSVKLRDLIVYLFDMQGIFGGVNGLNHLWFMTAIALCYVVTPILQQLKDKAGLVFIILLIIGIAEYGWIHFKLNQFAWIWLYAIGYFFTNLSCEKLRIWVLSGIIIVAVALTLILDWNILLEYDNPLNRLWHDVAGLALCLGGIKLLEQVPLSKLMKVLKPFDANSFYVYITHHVYLLGPLAVIPLISEPIYAVSSALVLTALSACVLLYISDYMNRLIQK